MKKFIITAVMALLIGGLAFNANAQKKVTKEAPKAKTEAPKTDKKKQMDPKQDPTVKYAKMIADYETIVNKCVKLYKESTEKEGQAANRTADTFEKNLNKALRLRDQIKAINDKLSDAQKEKYKKLTDELEKLITK